MTRGSGCVEVIDHLKNSSFLEEGAEARVGWVDEYVGGEALETVSVEHTFEKAECEVNREMGSSYKEMPWDKGLVLFIEDTKVCLDDSWD